MSRTYTGVSSFEETFGDATENSRRIDRLKEQVKNLKLTVSVINLHVMAFSEKMAIADAKIRALMKRDAENYQP